MCTESMTERMTGQSLGPSQSLFMFMDMAGEIKGIDGSGRIGLEGSDCFGKSHSFGRSYLNQYSVRISRAAGKGTRNGLPCIVLNNRP